jgi:hypothetical protein
VPNEDKTPIRRRASASPQIESPDMTVDEVMTFRHESETTVWRKCRTGVYDSFKSGKRRLITRASVLRDRDRCRAEHSGFPAEKADRGRWRKPKADTTAAEG